MSVSPDIKSGHKTGKICLVSVDVEEDLGTKTFRGVENLDNILDVFDDFGIRATLFVTGEVIEKFPVMVQRWSRKHEIGSHGYYHTNLRELSHAAREQQLAGFCALYEKILGQSPRGFRAVQHSIDEAQLKIIERLGFAYDSSVIPGYVPLRRYAGFRGKAPVVPYHPSYDDCRKEGNMRVLEVPCAPVAFGVPLYGTWIRVLTPRIFDILLIRKPGFISLAMHSWDGIGYTGPFSRNSGKMFLKYLPEMLAKLRRDYRFLPAETISRQQGRQAG
ncbi:MAG: polysaccharide deacetylase family protein [Chloroflexi bacterium]|nr:polysaccharide deacetylase family protein [Chloroflexota bacterium]